MSQYFEERVTCPHCHAASSQKVANSVNGTRTPRLREEILAGTFQQSDCPSCGERFTVDHPFLYVDLPRKQWVGVFAPLDRPAFERWEREPLLAWQKACGDDAPKIAQALGRDVRIRAVFSLPALREKLLCWESGLDDVVLELLKIRMMLAPDGITPNPGQELRLVGFAEGALKFQWGSEGASINAAEYASVAAVPEDWAQLRAALLAGPWVDAARAFGEASAGDV